MKRSRFSRLLDRLDNARWWLFDERNRLQDACVSEATKLGKLPERQDFERRCQSALAILHSANQRYKKALTLSIVIPLLMFFIVPINQAAACGMLLNMAPYLIRSMEDPEIHMYRFPLDLIKKLSRGRDTFANAVFSIGITLAIAVPISGALGNMFHSK